MERFTLGRVSLEVLHNGRDPDGVEAHVLDVVELADDALPCTTAVDSVGRVARRAGAVGCSEPVGDKLEVVQRRVPFPT